MILLFKELPLHLWMPRSSDMQLIRDWLLDYQLTSSESNLARVILGGLNWGSRTHVSRARARDSRTHVSRARDSRTHVSKARDRDRAPGHM